MSNRYKPLIIGNVTIPLPIVCGGMGVGLSNKLEFVLALMREGVLPTISSAAIKDFMAHKLGKKDITTGEAVKAAIQEIRDAGGTGPLAINVMYATEDHEEAIRAAIEDPDYHVDVIVCGAGLPLDLPKLVEGKDVALVVIVSSGRTASTICKRWWRAYNKRLPDAIIVEGPEAGGHLGFKSLEEIEDPKNALPLLVKDVLSVTSECQEEHGIHIPVIAAGGIFTGDDVRDFMDMGCSGVQVATLFLATEESGASPELKQAIIDCGPEDIAVFIPPSEEDAGTEKDHGPGSPCGLPFRAITFSPQLVNFDGHKPPCRYGFLRQRMTDGTYRCLANSASKRHFCICSGLLSTAGAAEDDQVWTVGKKAALIKKISTVKEVVEILTK